MPPLPELRSALIQARWEFKSQHNLAASAAETMRLSDLLALADTEEREDWEKAELGYSETSGTLKLRASIARTYGSVAAEDVLCFSSGKEAIFAAIHALVGPHEHAVIVTPAYQPSEEIPLSVGTATGVALRQSQGWHLDLDEVRAALKPSTRLISINFPHNPTGALIDRSAIETLVALAAERGVYILSDEVYRGLEHDASSRLPPIADLYPLGLSLNATSKVLGLPGLRIAWIALREQRGLGRILDFKHYLSDGNTGTSEILARIALKASEHIVTRNRAIVADNLDIFETFFARHRDVFDWEMPQAGCIAYPRYKGRDGVETFCRRAIEEAGILLLPASAYRSRLSQTPIDRFRIGFGKRSAKAGIDALDEFLRAYPVKTFP